jgi:hypothetical protein
MVAVKVKIKLSLYLTKHHAMNMYRGSGGIAPLILNFGTRRRRVVSFTPRPRHPEGMNPRYRLDRRLGGPQSRSGRRGKEKQSLPLRESNPSRPTCSQALERLSFTISCQYLTLFKR